VSVDGRVLGVSPQRQVKLTVGTHKARFECGECVPAETKKTSFEVVEGKDVKVIVTFSAL
jgi:hypothetical protein